tara:strand:- start:1211 stop:1705 length:495 start_codon:yes stop_codon:yes gene_type:complete
MNNYLSIKRTKELNHSITDIWSLITTPSYLELVHPFCKKNTTVSWSGVGSKDTLVYINGLTFVREIITWDEMKGYELTIGKPEGRKSKVVWKIDSNKDKTFLTIEIFTHSLKYWPGVLYLFPYFFIIKPTLENYLDSVLGGIDYYLNEKTPVPKNYFGSHRWFS